MEVNSDPRLRAHLTKLDALTRIPSPLHSTESSVRFRDYDGKSSSDNQKALDNLWIQMYPLFLFMDIPETLVGEDIGRTRRKSSIRSHFLNDEDALLTLRQLFPNAFVYMVARDKVITNWDDLRRDNAIPNDKDGWIRVSDENAIGLFGEEQWAAAKELKQTSGIFQTVQAVEKMSTEVISGPTQVII